MTQRWLSGLSASALLLGCAGEAVRPDSERLRPRAVVALANHQTASAQKFLQAALAAEKPALTRDQRATAADAPAFHVRTLSLPRSSEGSKASLAFIRLFEFDPQGNQIMRLCRC